MAMLSVNPVDLAHLIRELRPPEKCVSGTNRALGFHTWRRPGRRHQPRSRSGRSGRTE